MEKSEEDLLKLKVNGVNECINFIKETAKKFDCDERVIQVCMFETGVISIAMNLYAKEESQEEIDKVHRQLIMLLNHRFKEIEEKYGRHIPSDSPAPADIPN